MAVWLFAFQCIGFYSGSERLLEYLRVWSDVKTIVPYTVIKAGSYNTVTLYHLHDSSNYRFKLSLIKEGIEEVQVYKLNFWRLSL